MVDIQSAAAEMKRGIKKRKKEEKPEDKNIMPASAAQGGHNERAVPFCSDVGNGIDSRMPQQEKDPFRWEEIVEAVLRMAGFIP